MVEVNHIQLHPFLGLDLDTPPRYGKQNKFPVAKNVIFKDGCIDTRYGYELIGTNCPLNGRILHIVQYDPFLYLDKTLLAFTKRDAYRYDSASDLWLFITKNFTTGTITVAGITGASYKLRGTHSATGWLTAWNKDNIYQIRYGTTSMDDAGVTKTGCSWSASATTLTVGSATDIIVGQIAVATGIPADAHVTNIAGTTITIDKTTTGAGVAATVIFECPWHTVEEILSTSTMNIAPDVTITGNLTITDATVTNSDTSELYAGMALAGVNIPNGTTVASITSGTEFEMSANASASETGATIYCGQPAPASSKYVLRLCWSGGDNDYFESCLPVDGTYREKFLVVTNYIDQPQVWKGLAAAGIGDGFMADLGGTPPSNARHCAAVSTRTLFGYITDGGDLYVQSIRASNFAEPEGWDDAVFVGLNETDDEIVGIFSLKGRFFILKNHSITEMMQSYEEATPFNYTENKWSVAVPSARCIANYDDYVIMRTMNDFYLFDGVNIKSISEGIKNTLNSEINEDKLWRCHSAPFRGQDLYLFFYPYSTIEDPRRVLCFDLKSQAWSRWEFGHTITAATEFEEPQGLLTYGDLMSTTYSQMLDITFADLLKSTYRRRLALGDIDGNVYVYGDSNIFDDDGESIEAIAETVDHPINTEKQAFIFEEMIAGLRGMPSGQMSFQVSTDAGVTWSPLINISIASGNDYIERVMKLIKRGKRIRIRILNKAGSRFHLESLLLGSENVGVELRG